MYEFYIYNEITGEQKIVWGYDWNNAKKRHNLDDNWIYTDCEYVD